jgi:hypothetical protein
MHNSEFKGTDFQFFGSNAAAQGKEKSMGISHCWVWVLDA